ncbi:MAG TPA: hypothetical protein RMH99_10455 [Sandaracinaceae bacterium LLY-WYZ-13_1]|nr:hypothetical protein [Sandaracinaceae bacterium LLY-WYZ-13_1]
MTTRSLSRIPFDPREERVLSGLARWMGLLGRFQIVAAVFVFVVLLGVTGLVTTAEVIEPASNASTEQPLVSIGEVSRTAVAVVVAVVVGFSLIFLRGGMLLISGAEDLEHVVQSHDLGQHHLEEALGRLRRYFVLESLFMAAVAAATYAATIAGWGT